MHSRAPVRPDTVPFVFPATAVDFLARARQIAANADADANPRADAPSAPRVTPWSRARGDARGAGSGSASALADYVDEDLPDYTETFEEATRRLCARQGSSKHALFEVLRDAGPKVRGAVG